MQNFSTEQQKSTTEKFLTNSFFWWIILTVIYTAIWSRGQDTANVDFVTRIGQFIGLFVPFGPQNFIDFFIYGAPLLIILGLYEWIAKNHFSKAIKIIGIFALLLLITMVLDLISYKQWCSWTIFIHHYYRACQINLPRIFF